MALKLYPCWSDVRTAMGRFGNVPWRVLELRTEAVKQLKRELGVQNLNDVPQPAWGLLIQWFEAAETAYPA